VWHGKREKSAEALLLIKTTGAAYKRLEQVIRRWHPYTCPEILRFDVKDGFKDYIKWIKTSINA
jgi:periplasmic divalent cation tolerance protein